MSNNPNQPREYDAVLGGQAPPPVTGVVLGGIEGVKTRLASSIVEARVAAVKEALNYGSDGLNLVIQALNDSHQQVRHKAHLLLQDRVESQAKQALEQYKFWQSFERLYGLPYKYADTFANRKIEEFNPETGITDPFDIAYALRVKKWVINEKKIRDKFEMLLQDSKADLIEALVFGYWDYEPSEIVVDTLVTSYQQLTNLKALFIGDIQDNESMISSIEQSDISPVLTVYPNLEVLKIRGGSGLAFSPWSHEKLKALTIETGGLSGQAIAQICALDLPALEYLELWLGSNRYGGNSTIFDVMPIISGEIFPKLKYLGLRNSEYSDDIAKEIVKSPLINRLVELDLSMGTLGEEGAKALLNCPAINWLDTLNLAQNYLKGTSIIPKLSQLDCQVIINDQRSTHAQRYCSVAE